MKAQHDLARDYRDTDNRDAESLLAYYEERIKALTERIAELEEQLRELIEPGWQDWRRSNGR